MNKEEILAKSREENKKRDPYGQEVERKANSYSMIAAWGLSVILCVMQIIVDKSMNYGMFAVILMVSAVNLCYKAVVNKTGADIARAVPAVLMTVIVAVRAFLQIFE